MMRYQNLSGTSGVRYYQIQEYGIVVQFSDGAAYEYTYHSAGANNVYQMKMLAMQGKGLNTFINRHVKKLYSRKLTAAIL